MDSPWIQEAIEGFEPDQQVRKEENRKGRVGSNSIPRFCLPAVVLQVDTVLKEVHPKKRQSDTFLVVFAFILRVVFFGAVWWVNWTVSTRRNLRRVLLPRKKKTLFRLFGRISPRLVGEFLFLVVVSNTARVDPAFDSFLVHRFMKIQHILIGLGSMNSTLAFAVTLLYLTSYKSQQFRNA